ncbi:MULTISPECIES: CaiB/BaiF CoA transferase family protein [Microbacterium]|uniref:CoA transferase n=1 Tax=Microbacterium wangchenii TaxID=2541726 RepID=A0ABX5SVY0_9MICO|nr:MULTISPECIES: CoA transferase [Microbacterium]MCK6066064.1 CoA transferase [Microbacterium sp. EYE_512]QBR90348.1 CoA transferase [Microbacterium wangchenii]TFV84845.1 CoA transferase [Microbacterium sp. dk485]TXK11636.1 CoA transferase [Microbacterium wangchenii]
MSTKRGPLEGKTVLDLTTALAGPYATLLLAGLGARVIKIENPTRGGDSSRNNSPYVTEEGLSLRRTSAQDMSVSMMVRGRNKESITLNLKHPRSREVFLDLAREADIVVENYSAGVTERLGIHYAAVREVNPRLVYTSISGFGAQGGDGKAMDTIIQALSGVMMTAGEPGDPPVRFGLPVGDLVAPLFAVIGTLSAVLHAEKTGEGQHVDVSMLGSLTSLVACEPFDALESVGIPLRTGAVVPRLAPFGTFRAVDGWFAICAPTDAFAAGLLRAIGRPDLVDDPDYATRDARVRNAGDLHGRIQEWSARRPVSEVLAALEAHAVPAAPVRDTAEAVRDELVLSRKEVVPLIHPQFGFVEGLYGSGLPVTFSRSATDLSRPAPGLGEQTEVVLGAMLGYDDATIDQLRSEGVL